MSDYTIVDASGEILKTVTVPDAEHLALNTPDGATAVDGSPPSWNCYYADFSWIDKGLPASAADVWDAETKTWGDPRTLSEVRAGRWVTFRAHRDALEFATFTWDGSVFDADQASQARIQGAVVLALIATLASDTTYSQDWKLADNSTRTLSAAEMIQVGVALGLYVKGVHAAASVVYEQLQEAATLTAVNAVEWDSP